MVSSKTLGGYFKRYPLGALRSRNKGETMTDKSKEQQLKEIEALLNIDSHSVFKGEFVKKEEE